MSRTVLIIVGIVVVVLLVVGGVLATQPGGFLYNAPAKPTTQDGCVNKAGGEADPNTGQPRIYAAGETVSIGTKMYICDANPTDGTASWQPAQGPANTDNGIVATEYQTGTVETAAAPCDKHGAIAYNDGNNGLKAAVIGGAYEACYIVGEVNQGGKGYVFALMPTQWFRLTATGGTGWFIANEAGVEKAVADSIKGIMARGEAKPTVVRFDQGVKQSALPGAADLTVGPKK